MAATPGEHQRTDETGQVSRERVVLTEEALRIHRSAIVVDGHNDLPWRLRELGDTSFEKLDLSRNLEETHTDIPRLRQGGLGVQFWAAYVPPDTIREGGATRFALEQIDLIHRMVQRYPDVFELACSADDVLRIRGKGRIASLIGVEGGHAIENSLAVLRTFHALGVRYLTLTHVDTLDWADAATDEARHGGLTEFGEDVVREMNRLGMMVDVSHVSVDTVRDVLRVSRAPVIASHSSAFALAAHARNLPDRLLRAIADHGGVIMINFFSGFLAPEAARVAARLFDEWRKLRDRRPSKEALTEAMRSLREQYPMPRGTIHTLADHIDHVVQVAGIDHVGLGSDYDGITELPEQLDDVSCYPLITQAILDRGYGEGDIRKILGENVLRVLRQAQAVANI